MRVNDRLPNELWLEVLQALPRADLRSVAASNRKLLRLARSLLFRHVSLRFCNPTPGYNRRGLVSHIPDPHSLAKIELFTAPEIAGCMRSASLSCIRLEHHQRHRPVRRIAESDGQTCGHFMALFLELSDHFVNLRRLNLYRLALDAPAYHAITRLPSLKQLVIHWANLYGGDEVPTEKLAITCFGYYGDQTLDAHLRLIDTSQLHTVYIGNEFYTFKLGGLAGLGCLKCLAINSDALDNDLGEHDLSQLTPDTFPCLQAFSGPLDIALPFIDCCQLERLFIDEILDTSLRDLCAIPPDKAARITTLGLSHILLDHDVLSQVVTALPRLAFLAINACGYDDELHESGPHPFRDLIEQLLATIAPPTLAELHVSIAFNYPIASTRDIFVHPAPSRAGLLATAVARCPLLRAIYIVHEGSFNDQTDFALSWERYPSGAEERHMTDDIDAAKKIRKWMLPHRIEDMWGF
ncbi:F-box domain-containing protein [Mycena indigotica]|uniref:F-box domain-containing protein n=1 Tax=Mycena indigotica TaxID=2126181 RepID=A0A8H6S503_9AGAR|nr:F-box domain-containing protein [Mycena indigotica]KAF7292166.1 F-box domain-containing protein [Mycena indigotica]